jgi:hypothetical protein
MVSLPLKSKSYGEPLTLCELYPLANSFLQSLENSVP